MTRLLGLLCLLLWSPAVMAATYSVRSANHEGFTRVVVDAPESVTWTVTQIAGRTRITLSDPEAAFDLSSFFRRIDRSRIIGAAGSAPGTLTLDLICECAVEDFRVGTGMIVFDIQDGPPIAQSPPPRAIAPVPALFGDDEMRRTRAEEPPPQPTLPNVEPASDGRTAERVTLPLFVDEPGRNPGGALDLAVDEAARDTRVGRTIELPGESDLNALSEAEEDLLRQITRATSQGLVTPRTALQERGTNAVPTRRSRTETTAIRPKREQPNVSLRAITTVDEGSLAMMESLRRSLGVEECLPDSMLDVNAWADPLMGFAPQIGDLRRRLSDERDGTDQAVATELARTYLYFGFGAEAAQVLGLRNRMSATDHVMMSMARIVDAGSDPVPGPLHGLESCDGHAALWAALAAPTLTPGGTLNEAAVLRSFTALPEHLRLTLGPTLSRRLVAAEKSELAASILRVSRRLVDEPNDAMEMAEVDLLMAAGEKGEAVRTLEDIIADDGEMSPEALVKLVTERFKDDLPVDADVVEHVEILAKEHEEGDQAQDLRNAVVLARIQAGQYAQAFDEIAGNRESWPGESWREIQSAALDRLTAKAGDADFLKNVMSIPQDRAMATNGKTGNSVARRLMDLGFIDRAEDFLAIRFEGSVGRERRLLRAELALSDGRPDLVPPILGELEGRAADLLRAEALMELEEFEGARTLYAALGQEDRAAEAAWLAGNWDSAKADERSAISQAAALAGGSMAPGLGDEEPAEVSGALARNRALLEGSEGMRATISDLLRETEIETDPALLN